jgi:hypothetical protein
MLAQKGAEVSFTQSSFKIVVNQCCVAEGYLEDNLYWLDASSIGLNAHVKVLPHWTLGISEWDTCLMPH